MDDARALLDSLMGRDRNLAAEAQRVPKFTDDDICRNFLLGFCPNLLFTNTKYDLGQCTKAHTEHLKEAFEKDERHSYYRRKWRPALKHELSRLLEGVDKRIALNKIKIAKGQTLSQDIEEEQKKKVAALKEEMAELLKRAEEIAEEGQCEESQALVSKTELLKKQIEELSRTWFEKYRKELICDVCGVIVDSEEAASIKRGGSSWHENGRQHLGFKAIREHLRFLDKEESEEGLEKPEKPEQPEKREKQEKQETHEKHEKHDKHDVSERQSTKTSEIDGKCAKSRGNQLERSRRRSRSQLKPKKNGKEDIRRSSSSSVSKTRRRKASCSSSRKGHTQRASRSTSGKKRKRTCSSDSGKKRRRKASSSSSSSKRKSSTSSSTSDKKRKKRATERSKKKKKDKEKAKEKEKEKEKGKQKGKVKGKDTDTGKEKAKEKEKHKSSRSRSRRKRSRSKQNRSRKK
mmetsp:Transcript_15519/g.42693  ORF Transcript_15519/g.42693 Transcript_15519/m.42693 type:complete len:461 (-) Transcript_15519:99-1481(-)